MRYLLDTTVLIDHVAGLPGALAAVARLFDEPSDLYTCDVVTAESLAGGTDEQRRAIVALLDVLEYVSTTPDEARGAGELRRGVGASGPRGLGDAMIAAIARGLDAAIVTRNPRDFVRLGARVVEYR